MKARTYAVEMNLKAIERGEEERQEWAELVAPRALLFPFTLTGAGAPYLRLEICHHSLHVRYVRISINSQLRRGNFGFAGWKSCVFVHHTNSLVDRLIDFLTFSISVHSR